MALYRRRSEIYHSAFSPPLAANRFCYEVIFMSATSVRRPAICLMNIRLPFLGALRAHDVFYQRTAGARVHRRHCRAVHIRERSARRPPVRILISISQYPSEKMNALKLARESGRERDKHSPKSKHSFQFGALACKCLDLRPELRGAQSNFICRCLLARLARLAPSSCDSCARKYLIQSGVRASWCRCELSFPFYFIPSAFRSPLRARRRGSERNGANPIERKRIFV